MKAALVARAKTANIETSSPHSSDPDTHTQQTLEYGVWLD